MEKISLTKQVNIASSPSDVFELVTDPKALVEYYPIQSAPSDRCVEGSFILKGQAGEDDFVDYGVIEVYEPGKCFRYNYWSTNHGTEDIPSNRMTIEYKFVEIEKDRTTHLEVIHDNLLTEERRIMMDQFWDYLLSQLKSYAEKTQ